MELPDTGKKEAEGKGSGPKPWELDAQTMTNPGQALTLKSFNAKYFPQFKGQKITKSMAMTMLTAYFSYLGVVITVSKLKGQYEISGLMTVVDQCLAVSDLEGAQQYLGFVCQAIQGQVEERPQAQLIIDNHQWKHYAGGESGACQFTLTWKKAHQLMLCGLKKYLNTGASVHTTGLLLIIVTDEKSVGTCGDKYPGETSNVVKLELNDLSATKNIIAFHGYPIAEQQYVFVKAKKVPIVNITSVEYNQEELDKENNQAILK